MEKRKDLARTIDNSFEELIDKLTLEQERTKTESELKIELLDTWFIQGITNDNSLNSFWKRYPNLCDYFTLDYRGTTWYCECIKPEYNFYFYRFVIIWRDEETEKLLEGGFEENDWEHKSAEEIRQELQKDINNGTRSFLREKWKNYGKIDKNY